MCAGVVAARCSMTTCMCLYAREAHREVLEDDMQIRVVSSGLASNGTARIHVLPHKMGRRSLARTTAGSVGLGDLLASVRVLRFLNLEA